MDKKAVLSRLEKMGIEYAFYYHDKKNPPFFAANQTLFRSASVIKVPILLAWIVLEKQRELDRTKICKLDHEPQVGGAGFARQFTTRKLSFADVLLMMIATSDNLCTNLILREIGIERLRSVMEKDLGLVKTRCERKLMDYAARERGLDNYIDAEECIQLFRLVDRLDAADRDWVKSLLLANTDSALLMRSVTRDTIDFYHKTGSMTGVLHDWGFTDHCELFLFTQNVTDEPAVFEVFGELGRACLVQD
jgi:beta-lactamase class A